MVSYIVLSIIGALLIAADQITKCVVAANIDYGYEEIVVVENFFDIVHWHNTGGAWGVFSEHTWLLTLFSVICVLLMVYIYANTKPVFLKLSLVLIIAGAIGNIIDRIRLGYVIDFLSFDNLFGYQFPAFNIADICVTSGAVGLLIFVLFMSKKEPFREGTYLARLFAGDKNDEGKDNV